MNKDLNIRFCEICGCEINITKERLKSKKNSQTEFVYSDEGVYFEDGGVWFCNSCWKSLVDPIFDKLNTNLDAK